MKLVRREFLCLASAAVALATDTQAVLAQAPPAPPKLTQILRSDLERQGEKVQETMVTFAELEPGGEAPWHMHPGAQEILYILQGNLMFEVEGRGISNLKSGEIILIPAEVPHFARNENTSIAVKALVVHSRSDKGKPRTVAVKKPTWANVNDDDLKQRGAIFERYRKAPALNPRHRGAHQNIGDAFLTVGALAKVKEHLAALKRRKRDERPRSRPAAEPHAKRGKIRRSPLPGLVQPAGAAAVRSRGMVHSFFLSEQSLHL